MSDGTVNRNDWAQITSIIPESRHPGLDDYDRDAHAWKSSYVRVQDEYRIGFGAVNSLQSLDSDAVRDVIDEIDRGQRRRPGPGGRPGRPSAPRKRAELPDELRLPDEVVAWHWELHNDDGEVVSTALRRREGMPAEEAVGATLTAPGPGRYRVHLTLETTDGDLTNSRSFELRDQLVVSLGDSYASGQGNPDEKAQVHLVVGETTPPTWLEPEAHRSLRSAPARAAQRVEGRLGFGRLVTFLSFASTGATISNGLIDPQHPGWQPAGQIEEARLAIGDRHVDAVLLSIGGNDVGFADGLVELTARIVYDEAGTIRDTREKIEDLGAKFREVAERLDSLRPDHVLITEFPVALFDKDDGDPEGDCGVFELDPGERVLAKIPVLGETLTDLRRRLNGNLPLGVNPRQAEIVKTLGRQLNEAVRQAASDHGWTLVEGIADEFDGHGYCSRDSYYVTLQKSLFAQLDHLGIMHPNATGQVEMSLPIEQALQNALAKGSGERQEQERERTTVGARRGGTAQRNRDDADDTGHRQRDVRVRDPRGAKVRDHRRK